MQIFKSKISRRDYFYTFNPRKKEKLIQNTSGRKTNNIAKENGYSVPTIRFFNLRVFNCPYTKGFEIPIVRTHKHHNKKENIIGTSYLTVIAVLIAARDKYKGQPLAQKITGFLIFPLFIFLQIPLFLAAIFIREVKWKKIPHGINKKVFLINRFILANEDY